nr:hypothetical protein [Gaiella occulta]
MLDRAHLEHAPRGGIAKRRNTAQRAPGRAPDDEAVVVATGAQQKVIRLVDSCADHRRHGEVERRSRHGHQETRRYQPVVDLCEVIGTDSQLVIEGRARSFAAELEVRVVREAHHGGSIGGRDRSRGEVGVVAHGPLELPAHERAEQVHIRLLLPERLRRLGSERRLRPRDPRHRRSQLVEKTCEGASVRPAKVCAGKRVPTPCRPRERPFIPGQPGVHGEAAFRESCRERQLEGLPRHRRGTPAAVHDDKHSLGRKGKGSEQ